MAYSKNRTQYKSKYQVYQETSPTIDILCSGVTYDFTSSPRYEEIKRYVLDEVKKEEEEEIRFNFSKIGEEEMKMMLEDGLVSSPEEYRDEYGITPTEIEERINRYMLNITDLPSDLVLFGIDREYGENEQHLKQAIQDKYGYAVIEIKAHELASEKDALAQKTYEAIGNVYESDDYRKYLDLTSFWEKYSIKNVAYILAQRPDALALKGYGGISKSGEAYGWWAEGRGVATGAQAIKIWQPNITQLKTEKEVERYLKNHPEYQSLIGKGKQEEK